MVSVTNYNLSEVTEASGNKFVALLQYTSEQTNYVPGLIILLTMYFVIFFSLKNKGYGTPGIFASCNLAVFVIALLMYPIGIISGQILVICIVLVPVGGLMLYLSTL